MQTVKKFLLYFLIFPTTTQPLSTPGIGMVMHLYSRVSPLLTAVSKAESPKKDPVSIATDPSALIAGSAAVCSIGVSNKTMETQAAMRLLKRIPHPRNTHLRNAPGIILSTAIGVTAFQVLYLSGMATHKRVSK